MPRLRRLLLDVLKPNHPGILELGQLLARQADLQVRIRVVDRDDQTQTVQLEVEGADIDFARLSEAIQEFGASLHSIDEVDIESLNDS